MADFRRRWRISLDFVDVADAFLISICRLWTHCNGRSDLEMIECSVHWIGLVPRGDWRIGSWRIGSCEVVHVIGTCVVYSVQFLRRTVQELEYLGDMGYSILRGPYRSYRGFARSSSIV
eukprot:17327_1